MSILKGFLWFLFAVGLIAAAMFLSGNFALADRLMGLFLNLQPYMPLRIDFDLFQLIVTVTSLLISALAVGGSMVLIGVLSSRLAVLGHREKSLSMASKQEIAHVKEQQQREYRLLAGLGRTITKRLDKRVLVVLKTPKGEAMSRLARGVQVAPRAHQRPRRGAASGGCVVPGAEHRCVHPLNLHHWANSPLINPATLGAETSMVGRFYRSSAVHSGDRQGLLTVGLSRLC